MSSCNQASDPTHDHASYAVGDMYTIPVDFGNVADSSANSTKAINAKAGSDCSDSTSTLHKQKSMKCPGPLFQKFSCSDIDDMSRCSSSGNFMMHDVDISKNYGNGTVAVRGRESHTADLKEFDRYIALLEDMDREREEEIWKVGILPGVMDDDSEYKHSPEEKKEPLDLSKVPASIELKPSNVVSENSEEALDRRRHSIRSADLLDSNHEDLPEETELRFPFNKKFWTYFRSILQHAKPVGFSELENPTATLPKGPQDATAFISKVIAIKSINPIQPAALAKEGGFEEEEVLAELLYATSVGLVAMRFAPECVQCGSAVMDTDMLGRIPNRANCAGCNAPNTMDSLDTIKVMFLLNADVLYVLAENFACTPSAESMSHTKVFAAVPATATGSGFSYSIGTGEGTEIAPGLEPGKYRMHCPVAKTDNYLVVRRKSNETERPVTLRMKVSDLVCKHPMGKERAVLTVPHGRIQFDVLPDTKSFFVLWIQSDEDSKKLMFLPQEERDIFTPASKVMHHPIFNALFHEQQVVAVPKDIFFSISNVVLVFTDIVDSTRLYTNLGDGEAFRLVRKHFQVLFAAFIKQGGRVVKTVGDAVMASFTNGRAALQGVADAMELLPTIGRRIDTGHFIEIRVGVHAGRATVVPLNGVNDYFGQTSNIAARIQSVAKASECFVSQAVLDSSPDSLECYREIISPGTRFSSTPATELSLKGVEHKVHARGFRWVKRRPSGVSSSFSSVNTYTNRLEHTRVSFREMDDDCDARTMRLFERPAESGRRNSNMDPTIEHEDE